jgi:hypothetical protein
LTSKRAIVVTAVALTAGVASAVAGTLGDTAPDTADVRGAVFLGPICGGEPTGDGGERRCPRKYKPLRARIRFVRLDEPRSARTVKSSRDGRFRVTLPAGRYRVDPLAARGSSGAQGSREIELRAGDVEDLIVDYDTGIR